MTVKTVYPGYIQLGYSQISFDTILMQHFSSNLLIDLELTIDPAPPMGEFSGL